LTDNGWQKLAGVLHDPSERDMASTDDNDVPLVLEVSTNTHEVHPPAAEQSTFESEPDFPRVTLKNILQHPATDAVVLDVLVLHKVGPKWLELEIETVEAVLEQQLGHRMSDMNAHKLQAMRTYHLVDTPWHDWNVFLPCAMAVDSVVPDFHIMQVPTVFQCAMAIDVMNAVRTNVKWSTELKRYLEVVHVHDSVMYADAPFGFLELDVSKYVVNPKEIASRWPQVRASGRAPGGDTVTDEQLRRLLDNYKHLKHQQSLREHQLRLVQHA
jgi:hypothetical protein